MNKQEMIIKIAFQEAIGGIVDQFLRDGLDADFIREVLLDEANSNIEARCDELKQA